MGNKPKTRIVLTEEDVRLALEYLQRTDTPDSDDARRRELDALTNGNWSRALIAARKEQEDARRA